MSVTSNTTRAQMKWLDISKRPLAGDPQADLTILQDNANLKWLDIQWVVWAGTLDRHGHRSNSQAHCGKRRRTVA